MMYVLYDKAVAEQSNDTHDGVENHRYVASEIIWSGCWAVQKGVIQAEIVVEIGMRR